MYGNRSSKILRCLLWNFLLFCTIVMDVARDLNSFSDVMTVSDEPFIDGNVQFRMDMDCKRACISKDVLIIFGRLQTCPFV